MKGSAAALITLTALCMVFTIHAQDKKYTYEEIQKEIQIAQKEDNAPPDKIFQIGLDYYNNSTDIDALRMATSVMNNTDKNATEKILKEKYEKNPKNKLAAYLFARNIEDKVKVIEMGRLIIQLDPEWEYGYRLLTVNYMEHCFFKDDETARELKKTLASDEKHFEKFLKINTKDGISSLVYFKLLLNKKNPEAMIFAEKAKLDKHNWATEMVIADGYAVFGKPKEAYESFLVYLKEKEPGTSEEDLNMYAAYNVIDKLKKYGHTGMIQDFILKTVRKINDKERNLMSGMVYLENEDIGNAVNAIKKSAELGYDEIMTLERNAKYTSLKAHKDWAGIENKIAENRRSGQGERKKKILDSKLSKPAPDTKFTSRDGKEYTLESLKGNIVILDFWATWCGPCRMAMPVLSKFAEGEPQGVKIISVNVWEKDPEKAKEFFAAEKFKMGLAFGAEDTSKKFGFEGIPYICVVDKKGFIRFEEKGFTEALEENLGWWVEHLKTEK